MLHRLIHVSATLVLMGSLLSCGFQLKGTQNLGTRSLEGMRVSLIAANPRAELTSDVIQALRLSGAEIVAGKEGEVTLRIGSERFTRRNLALTAQARAAEVELGVATQFSLYRGSEELLSETTASVTRNMLDDPGNVVGKNEEMRLLRREMRREVAEQVVRRASRSL